VIVGFGEPLCSDSLNVAFFRIPVIEAGATGLPEGNYLVIAPSVIEHIDSGSDQRSGHHMRDFVEDFVRFFFPIKRALIARLEAGG
jgi:hypothetical protein